MRNGVDRYEQTGALRRTSCRQRQCDHGDREMTLHCCASFDVTHSDIPTGVVTFLNRISLPLFAVIDTASAHRRAFSRWRTRHSAAQGGSGLSASTYNAAGLHPNTVQRYSQDPLHRSAEPEKITAIRLDGE